MYSGVPSIRLEGDPTKALSLVPLAKVLLYRVQTFVENNSVTTFSATQRVDDSTYIYVLVTGNENIIFISAEPQAVDVVEPEIPIPIIRKYFNFYSGIVESGILRTKKNRDGTTYQVCEGFYPTNDCRNQRDELITLGKQDSARLAVQPYGAFDELTYKGTSNILFSQYRLLRPSMYSGLMQSAVQLVMGYGILPNDKNQPVPTQVKYDYKFFRTHGITRGTDGTLWLIEISATRGVSAMVLPVYNNTQRLYYEAVAKNDQSMITAIETLGALPTGAVFPADSTTYYQLVEEGKILRLLTLDKMQGFYSYSPFSPNMGWAFSPDGREAHNTGYMFESTGFQKSVWFQLNINIGPVKQFPKRNEPIADATASIVKQSEGYIYAPPVAGPGRFIKAKFHNSLVKDPGLYSHDGAPTIEASGKPVPLCDAPLYVGFINGELKVARFFRNNLSEDVNEVYDDRYPGECLYNNSWRIEQYWGNRSLSTMIYTNEFDDRRTLTQASVITDISSVDQGYDPPIVNDFLQNPSYCRVTRQRVYKRTTVIQSYSGEHVESSFVVPAFEREAYYYAFRSIFAGGIQRTRTVSYDSLTDPNVGYGWRKFTGGFDPTPRNIGCETGKCGGNNSERRIICLNHEPYPCSEFADDGQWLEECQGVNQYIFSVAPPRVSTTETDPVDFGRIAYLKLSITGHNGPINIPVEYSEVENRWEAESPDYYSGTVQTVFATHSALGEECVLYNTAINSGESKKVGITPWGFGTSVSCFVGVNGP